MNVGWVYLEGPDLPGSLRCGRSVRLLLRGLTIDVESNDVRGVRWSAPAKRRFRKRGEYRIDKAVLLFRGMRVPLDRSGFWPHVLRDGDEFWLTNITVELVT